MPGWSTEELQKLRQLWGDGMTCGQISRHMPNKSRNAVIGMAHRIGLSGRPNPVKRHATMAPMSDHQRRERRTEQQRERLAKKREQRAAEPVATPKIVEPMRKRGFVYVSGPRSTVALDTDTHAENVGKMTLEQTQAIRGCRYGYGHVPTMTFCGKVPADPWCPEHHRIVYRGVVE